MVDLWRDFWIRETGTGQQVVQLHERLIIIIIIITMAEVWRNIFTLLCETAQYPNTRMQNFALRNVHLLISRVLANSR